MMKKRHAGSASKGGMHGPKAGKKKGMGKRGKKKGY